ncbi:MAG: hypothetical protein ACR2PX_23230 [Endozoicomonas sp.]|uniref:hypothetical protein n=1 Tax=Endozoicomonas sp. TaxID=1892382 RepID=UPI003D9B6A19
MDRMILRYILALLSLMTVSGLSHAGHLFTQASSNTPTWIQSGQGIVINQYGDEGGLGRAISILIFKPIARHLMERIHQIQTGGNGAQAM